MSRPETIADLPDDVRRGNRAFDGNLFEFQNTPAVISAWGHLLEVATAAGFTLDEGTVYRPPTVSELEARLTEHQPHAVPFLGPGRRISPLQLGNHVGDGRRDCVGAHGGPAYRRGARRGASPTDAPAP